jgi:hypothetical protein
MCIIDPDEVDSSEDAISVLKGSWFEGQQSARNLSPRQGTRYQRPAPSEHIKPR